MCGGEIHDQLPFSIKGRERREADECKNECSEKHQQNWSAAQYSPIFQIFPANDSRQPEQTGFGKEMG